jgi:hypothetical protein
MAQEQSATAGTGPLSTVPGQNRLESLVISLIELKSSIVRVEDQHPVLGNDLSALCDLVIEHLNRPEDDQLETKTGQQSPVTSAPGLLSPDRAEIPQSAFAQSAARPSSPYGKNSNRLVRAFDSLGGHLVYGLDKMGDGIIYVLEKLISAGGQDKAEPPEESST